jgi:ADP-heptose:LPS heptosyltransferase
VLEKYPPARLYFLTFEQNRFSVDLLKIIPPERVFTISISNAYAFVSTTLRAVSAMRAAKIDVVFDLELFSRFSALLAGVIRAPARVGYQRYHMEGLYRGDFFTHPVLYNCHQHMAKNFIALATAIEHGKERPLVKEIISEPLDLPAYHPDKTDVETIMTHLVQACPKLTEAEYLIVMNPGAGDLLPIRAWPVENYIRLARKIFERFNAVIAVIGLEDASGRANQILCEVGTDRCINMVGRTDIYELLALFSRADLLITADCGPAHFAGLTGTGSVVLFGPESPTLYAPLGSNVTCLFAGLSCSPCLSAYNHRKTTCRDAACMRAITVDRVFGIVQKKFVKPQQRANP